LAIIIIIIIIIIITIIDTDSEHGPWHRALIPPCGIHT